MEGLVSLRHSVRQGDWFAKVDLRDAYLTVPVHSACRKYLHFDFDGTSYHFTCIPFGFSSAPWAFTKLLRPVMAFLATQGVRLIIYLDDILILGDSKDKTTRAVTLLKHTTTSLINDDKSLVEPTQALEFLGLWLDCVPFFDTTGG